MITLHQARVAKRLLRERFGADPRIQGIGLTGGPRTGYAVEVLLKRPMDPPGPGCQKVGPADEGVCEVPVYWRVVGRIGPLDSAEE
ncbi:hypothetical protein CDO52_19660 [Nocardiopsis gilva YIM 90087]|uniref:Uncharacterized protein n=1 Tax=Nocardiopsis gilva YIM 90087 TaxID=1235441 RepID=A0A223S9D7_9ACTN|nr:hypothetical protein [Nocardiopsis gilva]ASU84721.1 hypothetical protein CDO52_19660 [Nocardiopsis gilva YIM 90087]